MTAARSVSRYAAELLDGRTRQGVAVGHGYMLFGNDVVALTPCGALRLPNGIETEIALTIGERVIIGDGALRTTTAAITTGPLWNARPSPHVVLTIRPHLELDIARLSGWGPGLTPVGDDVLVGYIAARALVGSATPGIDGLAASTTALSRTFLSLAKLGELPESAHRLLEDGDPEPLLRFGATSGKGIITGLAAAAAPHVPSRCRREFAFVLSLPDGAHRVSVLIEEPLC